MEGKSQVALISGVIILWDALLARLALTADETSVYVLGHVIPWECALRRAGLPCPTCGMTRSMVMTLHGDFQTAWRLAPGGPVLLVGVLLAAIVLLIAAGRQTALPRWVRATGMVYAAAATMIWLGGWAAQFHHALLTR